MNTKPKTLLVNPPLWNIHSPYLSVPLLLSQLKEKGWSCKGLDLNIELIDWLFSPARLSSLIPRIESRLNSSKGEELKKIERALLVIHSSIASIDDAKKTLRSFKALNDHESYKHAHVILRDTLWSINEAFPQLIFDFNSSDPKQLPNSSKSIINLVNNRDDCIYRWAFEQILLQHILQDNVAVVAISLTSYTQLVATIAIASICKELRPDIHIVVGGNFATRMVSNWSEHHPFFNYVDSFILYEGEESLPLLLDCLFHNKSNKVPGLVTSNGTYLSKVDPVNVNLRNNIIPDFSDFPLDKYFAPGPILPIYSSRSCLWKCAFCSIPYASGDFRMRDSNAIVDEMEQLSSQHNTSYFTFVDEIMTVKSMSGLANELKSRNSDLFWYAQTRFTKGFTKSLATLLYQSGCRRLSFGLESYNQNVLNAMKKETQVAYISQNIQACLDAQIPIHMFVIIGFPGEIESEADNTIRFVKNTIYDSINKYNVPYSTWGASPFILDINSPIAQNPELYNIRIQTTYEQNDLKQVLDYEINHGMSQDDIKKYFYTRSKFKDLPTSAREKTWFHESSSKETEEEMFLRACANAGSPSPINRGVKIWPDDIQECSIKLSDNACIKELKNNFSSDRNNQSVVIYTNNYGYIIDLPKSTFEWLLELLKTQTIEHFINSGIKNHFLPIDMIKSTIGLLARFNYLHIVADFSIDKVKKDNFKSRENIYVFQEPFSFCEYINEHGEAMIVSTITGNIVKLNKAAYYIWEICKEGILLDKLIDKWGVSSELLFGIVYNLVDYGFLFLVEKQDSV